MYAPTPMNTRNPIAAYNKVAIENSVETANPHKLILMLFDGALMCIAAAEAHMSTGATAEKGHNVSRAINIINDGLRASLDMDQGQELAARLSALYEYMTVRLLHANATNDAAALKEVAHLLGELRSAWAEIADDPAVLSSNAQRG